MKKLGGAILLLLIACGKRGDPHPPVPMIPQPTSDLVVAQRGARVMLSWSFPSLTTTGQKLGGIHRVVLYRYVEELPVTQPPRDAKTLLPGDIDPTVPTAVALFAKIPPLGRSQFMRLRQRIDSIEGANLPAATAGARLMYEDSPAFHTRDGRPVRLDYAVVTEGLTARSEMSNVVAIVPIDVPEPPGNVSATAKPEGIVITWSAPQKAVTGEEKPRVVGYNIYRSPKGQPRDELPSPINAAPVSQTTYTDVPSYGAHDYYVSAVAATGPPRIESDLSAPAGATFADLLPPPLPTGLAALVETNAVRLVWDVVQAPDLAGYKVYRTEGVGHEPDVREVGTIPLQPLLVKDPYYVDSRADLGIAYKYGVASVDRSGNVSQTVWTGWVVVPKTP